MERYVESSSRTLTTLTNTRVDHYDFKPDRYSSHSLILEEFDPIGADRRVLDLGCGQGHLAGLLQERGYQVTGIDGNGAALREASQWCSQTICADVSQGLDQVLDERFSYILLADILEHLEEPANIIERVLPLLTDDGVLVVSTPNVAHAHMRLMLLFGRWNYTDRGIMDRTHLRFFTRKTLVQLLSGSGVTIRNTAATTLPWSIILETAPKAFGRAAELIDHGAGRLRPSLFAYQWVVSGFKGGTNE